MNSMLTELQSELIRYLCTNSDGTKTHLGQKAIEETLSSSETDRLCELISNEMMLNGIEETFEPNAYGKKLESLLDAVNGSRLHK